MTEHTSGPIRRFFTFLGKLITWLRLIVVNGVFLLVLLFLLSALFSTSLGPLPEKAPLRLQLTGFLVDQRSYMDPLTSFVGGSGGRPGEIVVRELVRAIDEAAGDERITALVLELQHFAGGGISKLEEVGQALSRFQESGKAITAVSDSYSQSQYYLASYADDIYMNPLGSVLLTGYASYRNYYDEGLEKLGVNMHIFRVGEYKDAVEPFIRNDMSKESREHNSQWLNQLWSVYTSRVEEERELPKDALNDYINHFDEHLDEVAGDAAQLALDKGLVDHLASSTEIRRTFSEQFGESHNGDNGVYLAIDYGRYQREIQSLPRPTADKIGLVVASGTIYDGEQPPGNIGADTLTQQIRRAREQDEIKALVLRIDSGGGSAFASEVIRNELVATQEAGIPVIVSMGSVAASGGYWIAASADEIWATPTTLTGSIGVFGMVPTLEETLEKLGIHTDGVGTTELSGAMRVDMPLSPMAENILQHQVDSIYRQFIDLVAQGRDIHPDRIRPIAGGRVWSGSSAQTFGLVDELGYLEDAVAAAASRAELTDYEVQEIKPILSPWQQLVQDMMIRVGPLGQTLGLLETRAPASPWQQLRQSPQWHHFSELLALVKQGGNDRVYAHCIQCFIPE